MSHQMVGVNVKSVAGYEPIIFNRERVVVKIPTGYTAKIYDGTNTDPKDFILTVARGLGFLIHMRDDSFEAPIRKREEPREDSYTMKSLQEYYEKREFFAKALNETILEQQEKDINEAMRRAKEAEKEYSKLRERYMSVRGKIEEWKPVTEAGRRVKEYALEQIDSSIDFDCNYNPWQWVPQPVSASEYRRERLAFYDRMIKSAEESLARDRHNAVETNRWIDELMLDLERL